MQSTTQQKRMNCRLVPVLVLSSYAILLYLLYRREIDIYSTFGTAATAPPLDPSPSTIQAPFTTDMDSSQQYWRNHSFDAAQYVQSLSNLSLQTHIFEKCRHIISTNLNSTLSANDIWSQAYQEWFIFHQFFHGKQDGVYVDIGANRPYDYSNSAFFDVCMGWKGICVEASPMLAARFENVRSCTMANHCAWSSTQKSMKMLFDGQYGGLSRIISDQEYQRRKQENQSLVYECDAISGTDILQQYVAINKFQQTVDLRWNAGARDNSTDDELAEAIEIDFISLDIEGAESEFLKCFPWSKYNVKVWSIEVNKAQIEIAVDRILYHNGYVKLKYLPLWGYDLDAVYVKQDTDGIRPPYEKPNVWTGKYSKCETP